MPSLADAVRRVRWLAVPLAAYLAITLALPAANGAAWRADFPRHAALVVSACIVVVIAMVGVDLLVTTLRRKP